MPHPLAVCSWSLRPTSAESLAELVSEARVPAVQLHLDPLREGWGVAATAAALRSANIAILSGMMTTEGEDYSTLDSIKRTGGIVPDATWLANLAAARENAAIASELGITLVTLHAGFVPHEPGPARDTIIGRVRELAGVFAQRGVRLGLETGQETAETLLGVLRELNDSAPPEARVGVNFDPANMILYGMGDPHAALELLGPAVVQLHAKDATPTRTPGTWGDEVPLGEGAVEWSRFFAIAGERCPGVPVAIEREAGESRVADVRSAAAVLGPLIGEAAP